MILLLLIFGVLIFTITFLLTNKQRDSLNSFHVANRNVGVIGGALTIASTWTWAPAVLVSAQKGYQQGFVGAFWFTVPNILTLIIFAFFAIKFKDKSPYGYTLPNYMYTRYGKRVHNVYKYLMVALNPMCFSIQLLAGGKIVSFLLGIDYTLSVVIIAGTVLLYTILCGLRSTIITDIVLCVLIIVFILIILPSSIMKFKELNGSVLGGIGGVKQVYTNIFNKDGLQVFLTYGIVQTIGLLAGPFGDQLYWHRVYAIEKTKVKKAFILGAAIFAIIPISMAVLGFIGAAGEINGLWKIKDVTIVNVEVINHLLPIWGIVGFALILLAALTTTMSSALSSFSSLVCVDILKMNFNNKEDNRKNLIMSRLSILSLAVIGTLIALIPNISLLYFFLFYTVVRACTLIPTIYTIITDNTYDAGIFYGILAALAIGIPTYGYGSINGKYVFSIIGSALTILIPLISIFIFSKTKNWTNKSKI